MAAEQEETDASLQLLLGQIPGSSVVLLGQEDGVWPTSYHLGPQPPQGLPHSVPIQVKLLGRESLTT